MFETEITINRFLLRYADLLASDIGPERMTDQPMPGVNHPAWILGHLAYAADGAIKVLGGEPLLDESWQERFGRGSQPLPEGQTYPGKEELLAALHRGYERAQQLASAATAEQLSKPNPNRMLREGLPTVQDLVDFLLTGHLGMHLGQFSTWRRMIGLPALF